MIVIGCFEVTKVSEGKWKCKNTFTGFEHRTYGTEEEVREQLERQSSQWKARVQPVGPIRPPQRGSAWRNKPPIEPKKKPEDR
jgi:hypothetical protein